ncbi:MAG: response regulator transcription factor [Deltaproteobacteria bacterium]|nr:response regulator transcription factor [Deltaproteobacteria bacterium]
MTRYHILIIEDEKDISELIRFNLEKDGYRITTASTGEAGLEAAFSDHPDLIILDLMLPGLDGLEVCKALKRNTGTSSIAIVMLTAKSEESDIIVGLELGADDYVTKPFSPKVLIARVRAVLRRKEDPPHAPEPETDAVKIHDLVIHPGRHQARLGETPIQLTASEFAILHFLVQRPGWAFSRKQIIDAVKGQDYAITDRAVDVHVAGLRKKLGSAEHYIETVHGVGYRFKE